MGAAAAAMRPAWFDELFTLRMARLPAASILEALRTDSGPPLHYLVVRALFLAVGWDEGSPLGTLVARLPSILSFAGIIILLGSWRAAKTAGVFPWGAALAASWLPLLFFASEARAYAPLALAVTALWLRGEDWLARGIGGSLAFVATAASLPLLHNTGILYLAALAFFPVGLAPAPARRAGRLLALATLPFLAWLPILLGQPRASVAWMTTAGAAGRAGLSTARVLSPAGPFPILFEAPPPVIPAAASVALLCLAVGGAVAGGFAIGRRRDDASRRSLVDAGRLVVGASPAAGLALLSLAGWPSYFAGRTESIAFPLAAAAVARLARGLGRRGAAVCLGPFVAVGLATSASWLAGLRSQPTAPGVAIATRLAPSLLPGDRIVAGGLWEMELRHGLATLGASPGSERGWRELVVPFPSPLANHPGWIDPSEFHPSRISEAVDLERREAPRGRRLWVVWSPGLPMEEIFFPAFARWDRRAIHRSPLLAVDLLTPTAGGAAR